MLDWCQISSTEIAFILHSNAQTISFSIQVWWHDSGCKRSVHSWHESFCLGAHAEGAAEQGSAYCRVLARKSDLTPLGHHATPQAALISVSSNGLMCSTLCHGGTILSKPESQKKNKNECFYLMLNKPGLRKPATPMRLFPPWRAALRSPLTMPISSPLYRRFYIHVISKCDLRLWMFVKETEQTVYVCVQVWMDECAQLFNKSFPVRMPELSLSWCVKMILKTFIVRFDLDFFTIR